MSQGFTRRAALGKAAIAAAGVTGAGRLLLAPQASASTPRTEVTAVVVGSGYGGAVTARRLGEAGIQTLVLEMGRSWDRPSRDGRHFSRTFPPDGRAMWLRTKTRTPLKCLYGVPIDLPISRYTGVLDRLEFPDMAVYLGRGVGGGSLVNGGMAVTPRRAEFEQIFPGVDAGAMYDTYFPRANEGLRTNAVPEAWFEQTPIHQYSRVARDQAHRAGYATAFVPSVYDYEYQQAEALGEVPASATAQEIFYGNNHGKRSLDQTYLPAALATGKVTIASLRTVTAITRDAAGGYLLSVRRLDELGHTVGLEEISCRYLFLAGGCMGTTELLLRARDTGAITGLSDQIGQGWGNNGNVSATRLNRLGVHTGSRQTTMPAMGIDDRSGSTPLFVEITALPTGFENGSSSYLGIARNPERGHLRYDAKTDRAQLVWRREQGGTAVTALQTMLSKINRQEHSWYRHDLYGGGRVFGDHYTWHPLGGCVLGAATDLYGRVHGSPGLYVNDGSLVPGYASVNPFVTITALAERNIERVIADDLKR